MRRFLLVCACLLLGPTLLLSQVSATITTYEHQPKELVVRHLSGDPLTSVWVNADLDTLQFIDITGEVIDTVELGSVTSSKSVIRFTISSKAGGTSAYQYTDTLKWNTRHIIPYQTVNNISDSVFYVELADSAYAGEKFRIYLKEVQEVRMAGDTLVTKPDFSSSDSLNTY